MKKRVLFLIYKLVGGGAEKVMVDIVNHLDPTVYEVTVITVVNCSSDASKFLNRNIKYDYLFSGKLYEDRLFFKFFFGASPKILHQLFIRKNYDVKIAALEGIPAKIISGCEDKDTKKIVIIHADASNIAWPTKRFKDSQQEFDCYNGFNKLIFVSNNSRRKFLDKFNIEDEKTVTIYNPFDISTIRSKSLEPIEGFKKNSKYLFCAIGRLEKVKGFDRLIRAFYEVQKDYKNIELVILGDGKEYKPLSQLINEFNLTDKVRLLGYHNNPYKYLKISDCYICSSRSEGLSSTVIEAMILGKPIIATDCGGMDELLGDYYKGVIINNDIDGIISGMNQFLNTHYYNTDFRKYESLSLQKFSYNNYYRELTKII